MHVVEKHIGQLDLPEKKLLVACSGGVDSMVLLHSLQKQKIPFAVLHVNYQLRGADSDLDEQLVKQVCADLKIPFLCVKCPTEITKADGTNLQKAARDFRRKLFSQWTALSANHFVVLAHHLNDQEETFFLQYFRGSGTFGLRGMLAESQQLIRPFLELSKEELRHYAEKTKISWREDQSNAGSNYLRNLFRNEILPKLHAEIPALTESIGTFQKKLNDSIMNETADSEKWISEVLSNQFIPTEEWKASSEVTQLLFVKTLDLPSWSIKRLKDLFRLNLSAELVCNEYWFYKGTKGVYIRPKNRTAKAWECKIEKRKPAKSVPENAKLVCDAEIDQSKFQVQPATKEDKLQLAGMIGQKRVWDLLKEEGIPSQIRSEWPVLSIDNQVIWVPNIAVSDSPFTKKGDSSTITISLIEKVK